MPLYMDFHKIDNVTVDDVKSAHTADESIQEQYGVRYHQYWVNQKEGTVFCLVEGPDAKTCELVHQLAHGNLACAMTEVEPGSFKLFMGDKLKVDEGLTRSQHGEIDDGYRCVLVASIRGIATSDKSGDFHRLQIPPWAKEIVTKNINAFNGRSKKWEVDDTLTGVFNEAHDAIRCAEKIREELKNGKERPVILKIGITADQPVTHKGEFFSRAVRLGHRLCMAANDNCILVSALAGKLHTGVTPSSNITFLDIPEEEFIFGLLELTDNKLAQEDFNVASICRDMGISRPQLYRKITSLIGRAPNDFLRDLRLEKSLVLLKQRTKNISQVALEVGYSNPSYFAKCFAEKFGCMPSEVFASSSR
jgi:AraC-like DNA-binding protein